MTAVELSGVRKSFGSIDIIPGLDLAVEEGEFVVFVGPSGCGKSTLLRLIAGLETVSGGAIRIAGEDVTHRPPSKRGVAMVFQSYALFPHMTVADNISFGLRLAGEAPDDIRRKVAQVAETLQLTQLLERRPKQLSGGQRQRVAIGRAIIRNPKVFLFDEPLSNLDAALRGQMRIEIARLHAELRATMIYVTHDQVEAMTLADRIVVLNGGRIEQVGPPMELYTRPANRFVAGFIGSPKMNFFEGLVGRGPQGESLFRFADEQFVVPRAMTGMESRPVTLGIRPEDLSTDPLRGQAIGRGKLVVQERLGSETLGYYAVSGISELVVIKHSRSESLSGAGAVTLYAKPEAAHIFAESGEAL
jgi:multiple sugar transport system ATP-binding protein